MYLNRPLEIHFIPIQLTYALYIGLILNILPITKILFAINYGNNRLAHSLNIKAILEY